MPGVRFPDDAILAFTSQLKLKLKRRQYITNTRVVTNPLGQVAQTMSTKYACQANKSWSMHFPTGSCCNRTINLRCVWCGNCNPTESGWFLVKYHCIDNCTRKFFVMRCVRRQLIGNVLDDVSPAPIPHNCLFQWRKDHAGRPSASKRLWFSMLISSDPWYLRRCCDDCIDFCVFRCWVMVSNEGKRWEGRGDKIFRNSVPLVTRPFKFFPLFLLSNLPFHFFHISIISQSLSKGQRMRQIWAHGNT